MKGLPATYRKIAQPACDVFINHCSADTKRNQETVYLIISTREFLGARSESQLCAYCESYYCESYFCLHELALLMESKKRIVPIFYDVKPSQLCVSDNGTCSSKDLQRFSLALTEAKYTVGLTFNSMNGDWSELLRKASDAVIFNLLMVEKEKKRKEEM